MGKTYAMVGHCTMRIVFRYNIHLNNQQHSTVQGLDLHVANQINNNQKLGCALMIVGHVFPLSQVQSSVSKICIANKQSSEGEN